MKLRKIVGKIPILFTPLARISNAALYLAGYRDHEKRAHQSIPLNVAVTSGFLLLPAYIFAAMLSAMIINETILAEYIAHTELYRFLNENDLFRLIPIVWCVVGLSLAPLHVWRVRRVNARSRRYRLGVLERTVERETAAFPISLPVPRPLTTESPVSYVTQGIS